MTQFLNDHKAHCQFQDMLWKEQLEQMINDYKKWSRKHLNNLDRKVYLEIIKTLEEELSNARGKVNPANRGVMGYHIGKYNKENGKTRDSHNNSSKTISSPIRLKKERVYCISRKAI